MKKVLALLMIAAGLSGTAKALPLNLLGDTLQFSDGITATPNWSTSGTWLSWEITAMEGDLWHYEYVWHTDGADLSHIIIEVTEGAPGSDFWDWEYAYSGVQEGDPTFGWFGPDQGSSNLGMPGSIYGFVLNTTEDTPIFGFEFTTWRAPVWGDFYAKDGKHNSGGPDAGFTYAYNVGFSLEDGNDGLHIARPNGQVQIADGGLTVALLGATLMGVSMLRRRLAVR